MNKISDYLNDRVHDSRMGYSFGTLKLLDRIKTYYPDLIGPDRKTVRIRTEDNKVLWPPPKPKRMLRLE